MKIRQLIMATVLASAMMFTAVVEADAHTNTPPLSSKLLQLSDMPTGWSVDNSAEGSVDNATGCLATIKSSQKAKGLRDAKAAYAENQSVPGVVESIATGKSATVNKAYQAVLHKLNGCKQVSFVSNGTKVSGSMGAMSFPTVGNQSTAYDLALTAESVTVGADIVVFREGTVDGALIYLDLGTPDPTQLQTFTTSAVDRIEGKTPLPPTSGGSGTSGTT